MRFKQFHSERRSILTSDEIRLINPNTRTCATFRSQHDAELTKAIYRRVPILIREAPPEEVNPWGVSFLRMFDMSNDSHLFRTREQLAREGYMLDGNRFVRVNSDTGVYHDSFLPLYEAKMIHQFDHRWATYEGEDVRDMTDVEKQDAGNVVQSRYWVSDENVNTALQSVSHSSWMLTFRKTARSTDERTVIATILPESAVGDRSILLFFENGQSVSSLALLANWNSFVFDFVARQKVGGTDISHFYFKQFPTLPPNHYTHDHFAYLSPRVLELTYTAWDLQPFAHDLDYDDPPFKWDEDRRFQMRCELDALYFHLYGIARDDVEYIMESFPITRRKDEATYGFYRTKDKILTIYDDLANNL